MGHLARADLESLLRARKLDVTLTSGLEHQAPDVSLVAPVGIPTLDARLGGGLPRGHLSEIVGPRSSGRTSLLSLILATATARGSLVALIDTLDTFDPPSAAATGLDLERLLWVRGATIVGGPLLGKMVDRALKAFNLVLQAGGFDIVALDLASVPASMLRRIPFTTWMRVQRTIEGGRTACVLIAPAPIARSSAGATLHVARTRSGTRWSGTPGHRLLRGLDVQIRIGRARFRGAPVETEECLEVNFDARISELVS